MTPSFQSSHHLSPAQFVLLKGRLTAQTESALRMGTGTPGGDTKISTILVIGYPDFNYNKEHISNTS
ncbi:hypothetical protein CEP51_002572 [Fusarium floridanum]|uniref:Uncharacterized protein n=1 Tax=Fusarium floridanum TaxID=1325733 RepID=A0A428SAK4_9HYPO|nr:hypothetical protein CEP51_002572 [Fusarium floridanum]